MMGHYVIAEKHVLRRLWAIVFLCLMSAFSVARADEVPVDQHQLQFVPDTVVIKAGDTLVLTNHDNVTHNLEVLYPDGDAVDKGLQKPGEIVKINFDKPGAYEIHCMIHARMVLMITVN